MFFPGIGLFVGWELGLLHAAVFIFVGGLAFIVLIILLGYIISRSPKEEKKTRSIKIKQKPRKVQKKVRRKQKKH
jgi:hypothetical protein